MVLGQVLRALKDNENHIPFSSSTLTKQLQTSLGNLYYFYFNANFLSTILGNSDVKFLLLVDNRDVVMKTIDFGAEILGLKSNVDKTKASISTSSSETNAPVNLQTDTPVNLQTNAQQTNTPTPSDLDFFLNLVI